MSPTTTFLVRGDADDIDHDRQWLAAHRSAPLGGRALVTIRPACGMSGDNGVELVACR